VAAAETPAEVAEETLAAAVETPAVVGAHHLRKDFT